MKKLLAVIVLLAAVVPVRAQQLDLSTVTCKDFVTSDKETISLILMWLEGYYNEDANKPIVDFDQMQRNGKSLGEYCGKNPGHSLITAADDVMGK
jgi:acid stress chaperone HdeB